MPQSVVILRALQLGDLVCAVPAFRALRSALPKARLVLVGLSWASSFVKRFSAYLDEFREFPGFPGLPERSPDLPRIPIFLNEIQRERFDLAVQLHGSGAFVNPLTALFGARHHAGFFVPGGYCPDPERFLPWPDEGLEIHRLLKLVEFLGAPPQGDHLEFPITDQDRASLARIPEAAQLVPGRYVCVHPGASVAPRRWPTGNFAAVVQHLARKGFTVVLTGTAAETELTRPLAAAVAGAIDLAGKTDLGALGALLHRARLLFSNDTGVSHVAAGLGLPSVIISTGANPERWAPIDHLRHRVLVSPSLVAVGEALEQVEQLLSEPFDPSD